MYLFWGFVLAHGNTNCLYFCKLERSWWWNWSGSFYAMHRQLALFKMLVWSTPGHSVHEVDFVFNRKTKKARKLKFIFKDKKIKPRGRGKKWKSRRVTFFGTLHQRNLSHSSSLSHSLSLSPSFSSLSHLSVSLSPSLSSLSLYVSSFVMLFR